MLKVDTMKKFLPIIAALFAAFAFSAAPATAEDMASWKNSVVKRVASKQRYPRAALAREIQGKAKVRLNVDAAGNITDHEIVEATGERVLDNEIPKLVKRLNPLPALPEGRSELSFVLPLDWSLN